MMTVAVLCFDGVVPFDLSLALDSFGHASFDDGEKAYKIKICGPKKTVRTSHFKMEVAHDLRALRNAHTIIVPGIADHDSPLDPAMVKALRQAGERGARIASVCSGAFLLAHAGLLDGLKATTHWLAAEELRRRFPSVLVDPNVLYVDNGQILTSAGAAAGLDLCLHMIRKDLGAKAAARCAKLGVFPLERSGGQAQFIVHEAPESEGSLAGLLGWMQKNYHSPLTVRKLAERAKMSERTFVRRFKEQTGTSPLQWLLKFRIAKAREALESSSQSIELVAERNGFGSGVSFRGHFQRQLGISPRKYRAAFRA